MTTVLVSPRFQVVIPPVIRNALGIRPGQRIQVLQYQDRIQLIPLRSMHKVRGNCRGSSYLPRTELGRRLLELRERGIRSGMKLLTPVEIKQEMARRRDKSGK